MSKRKQKPQPGIADSINKFLERPCDLPIPDKFLSDREKSDELLCDARNVITCLLTRLQEVEDTLAFVLLTQHRDKGVSE